MMKQATPKHTEAPAAAHAERKHEDAPLAQRRQQCLRRRGAGQRGHTGTAWTATRGGAHATSAGGVCACAVCVAAGR